MPTSARQNARPKREILRQTRSCLVGIDVGCQAPTGQCAFVLSSFPKIDVYKRQLAGFALSYLAFARNSKKDSTDAGKESGTVLTEIGYIKANTDDIKRKQEKQDETLVKMTERVVKLEGDSARTNKRLEILESHDYGGNK